MFSTPSGFFTNLTSGFLTDMIRQLEDIFDNNNNLNQFKHHRQVESHQKTKAHVARYMSNSGEITMVDCC